MASPVREYNQLQALLHIQVESSSPGWQPYSQVASAMHLYTDILINPSTLYRNMTVSMGQVVRPRVSFENPLP